jgi:hypothetical protein
MRLRMHKYQENKDLLYMIIPQMSTTLTKITHGIK